MIIRFVSRSTTLSEVLFECFSAGLFGIKQTFLVGSILLSGSAWADEVLILDDQYGNEVKTALEAGFHQVTSVDYEEWDGTNPAPADFDLVLLLKGKNYNGELGDDEDSAAHDILITYVNNGGTFGVTEFIGYELNSGGSPGLESIVPFDFTTYIDYGYGGSFTTTEPDHPLTAGLDASWEEADDGNDAGACFGTLKPGAVVLVTRTITDGDCDDDQGKPALVYAPVGLGTIIWLNSDLAHYEGYDATPNHLKIIVNMVGYSAPQPQPSPAVPAPVPTLPLFGLGILASLLGFFGLRRLKS